MYWTWPFAYCYAHEFQFLFPAMQPYICEPNVEWIPHTYSQNYQQHKIPSRVILQYLSMLRPVPVRQRLKRPSDLYKLRNLYPCNDALKQLLCPPDEHNRLHESCRVNFLKLEVY